MIAAQEYEVVPLDSIQPHPENARKANMAAVGGSIDHIGFYGAVLVQRSTGHILVGNHRWKHLKAAKAETIPVLWLDVDDEKALRINVADNRISDLGGYDPVALGIFVQELPPSFLAVLQLGTPDQLPTNRKIEHAADEPNQAGSGSEASYGERLDDYKKSGVRSLVLDFTSAEYAMVTADLERLRTDRGLTTFSDVVWSLTMGEPDADADAA